MHCGASTLGRVACLIGGPIVLAVCLAAAYGHALRAGFLMDDENSITANQSIRSLWPLGPVVWYGHQGGRTIDGRPLLNLSFAINRAILGPAPESFRLVNDAIHWVNAVLLQVLLWSLLGSATIPESLRSRRMGIALAASLIWLLHPVCVGAVTYIVQRAESLAACGVLAATNLAWGGISRKEGASRCLVPLAVVSACAGGLKETAIVIPLVTIILDRALAAGSWREVVRHWPWHLAAAASWPVVVLMIAVWGGRGDSAGLSAEVSPWLYLLTQAKAIWIYLQRIAWPRILVFDHGYGLSTGLAESWPWFMASASLFAATCFGFMRYPRAFCGPMLFFVLLGPTSSVIPVKTQTIAEHRLYLPAAALISWAVVGFALLAEKCRMPAWGRCAAVVLVAACLGARTFQLNGDYLDPAHLWSTSLQASPRNERALVSLAVQLIRKRQFSEAGRLLDEAEAIGTVPRVLWLARSLSAKERGDFAEALRHCTVATRIAADDPLCHSEQSHLLWKLGRFDEAMESADRSLSLDPLFAPALVNRGNVWIDLGRLDRAEADFIRAVALEPWRTAGWVHLGILRQLQGRLDEAHAALQRAERCDPKNAKAAYNHGNVLVAIGDDAAAIAAYGRAIRNDPSLRDAYYNRGAVLLNGGDSARADADFQAFRDLGGTLFEPTPPPNRTP